MLSPIKSLALIAAFAAASPAFAETQSRTVSFADLNLASVNGRDVLEQRLDRAARAVCAVGGSRELSAYVASKRCYRGAIADARQSAQAQVTAQLNRPVRVSAR